MVFEHSSHMQSQHPKILLQIAKHPCHQFLAHRVEITEQALGVAQQRDCLIDDNDRGHCQSAKTLLTDLNQDLLMFLCRLNDNASLIVAVTHA